MQESQRSKEGKPQDNATIDRLIDRLKQSGLAKSVVVDKDDFAKMAVNELLGGKRIERAKDSGKGGATA